MERMKPGEKVRLECQQCLAEFDLTYEPKCIADSIDAIAEIPSSCGPPCCPFCQSVSVEDVSLE